jgi:hypothetical protein
MLKKIREVLDLREISNWRTEFTSSSNCISVVVKSSSMMHHVCKEDGVNKNCSIKYITNYDGKELYMTQNLIRHLMNKL